MSTVPRTLTRAIARALETFPAVLVTGPRQSGKTTLLRSAFATGRRFVSLEEPAVRARAIADPVGFFQDVPPPAILDDIQHPSECIPLVDMRIARGHGRRAAPSSSSRALASTMSRQKAGHASRK